MRTTHKKHLRRLSGVLTAAALTATAFAGMAFPVSAAQANWKFDLGGNGAAGGYTGVSASMATTLPGATASPAA